MKFLWAAYRTGTWKHEGIPDGLDQAAFTDFVRGLSQMTVLMVIKAPNKYGVVGLVSCREDRQIIEPHVDWFPWATARNKIEGTARSLIYLKKIKPLIVWSKSDTKSFFMHICRYGILKKCRDFGREEEKYALFQSHGE